MYCFLEGANRNVQKISIEHYLMQLSETRNEAASDLFGIMPFRVFVLFRSGKATLLLLQHPRSLHSF
jgi:hypothetical protein